MPIAGYLDRLSARPGETIAVKVSAQDSGHYDAAVFSVGSIGACGSLSHHAYRNPISKLLESVVRRFSAR
jgi:hypothetical protein